MVSKCFLIVEIVCSNYQYVLFLSTALINGNFSRHNLAEIFEKQIGSLKILIDLIKTCLLIENSQKYTYREMV